ncbi:MAG: P1 family peptidase [Corynebacterium sp.]|uniref:P1 family peptidase n=1 Tax=unclassified Corynebacterium TaxID=2624378 RepID=UPI0026495B8C|nr:P1 family peptidase [Corynebacterium sp.]MDN5582040.1 P1 family peptidase [Corynebacterium sp.]MDN5719397.1 P1 family peptidase [Corynebacterium sp.]MDN6386591.1 P1 family peptidase [Corynebacterium sp.]MDN6509392.1 P1 family peptidase [Corynebacterium sp.]
MSTGGLTDVPGLFLGHAEVQSSGVSVVVCPEGAVGAVDVRGGGPGTRETDLLAPSNSAEAVHAVALCGGSAFGLDAAGGVMAELEDRGIGLQVLGDLAPSLIVPIVPSAVIFDLPVGDPASRPTADTGRRAVQRALDCSQDGSQDRTQDAGNVGAGRAATAGALKGGFGEASCGVDLPGGGRAVVAVGLVVNAVGSVVDPSTGALWGNRTPEPVPEPTAAGLRTILERGVDGTKMTGPDPSPMNTTIGVVATDATVTKAQAERLAMAAHDGLARAVRPSHLPMDGDTFFALAPSGARGGVATTDLAALCAAAATVTERAVVEAVLAAETAFDVPSWRDVMN